MDRNPEARNLGLPIDEFKLRTLAMPGFSLDRHDDLTANEQFVWGADILIIEIGTNDLCNEMYDPRLKRQRNEQRAIKAIGGR